MAYAARPSTHTTRSRRSAAVLRSLGAEGLLSYSLKAGGSGAVSLVTSDAVPLSCSSISIHKLLEEGDEALPLITVQPL